MTTSLPLALLIVSTALAGPPAQAYLDGDVIEIMDITATSPRMEQGDSVTVRGRIRLDSREEAQLSLLLTQTEGDGIEETDSIQTVLVRKGQKEFTLKITIKHRGVLHLTMYDTATRKPFGGTYFGTAKQMKAISDWDVSYYLQTDKDAEGVRP